MFEEEYLWNGWVKKDEVNVNLKLDESLPANPENDRRFDNAVTLKSTFCLP